ncbi:MAG: glycolate oxidase subunit GlcF [Caulobacteraceae bacterium]
MQTQFSPEQLADPATASSERVIRKCVHCGFCLATCPTYVLLGDELDSPRGRIYLIKDMLENDRAPTPEVVKHIDRCLSCLSCMTTCPSGVDYRRLVDHARDYIEHHYTRPWPERALRWLLAATLPYPARFRAALTLARLVQPLAERVTLPKRLAAMFRLAPKTLLKSRAATPPVAAPRGRVALLQGCAEQVLEPQIRQAASRLLGRAGFEAIAAPGEGCCGALVHHMGREDQARDFARRNVDAWTRALEADGLDAIVITASGCGSAIKDYGFLLKDDPAYAAKAARVSALAKDVGEFLAEAGLPAARTPPGGRVAYQAPCSLQHGQRADKASRVLLAEAGFEVCEPAEPHLCCGSAGVYNIMQPEIAGRLRERKLAMLTATGAELVASGNIGCITQLAQDAGLPVVHTVELLDWAHGGLRPAKLPGEGH